MTDMKMSLVHVGMLLGAELIAAALAPVAWADEIHIKMVDNSDSGPLAFEPGLARAKVGDKIVFEPTQTGGHSTVSLLVPAGAQPLSGAPDKETQVTLGAGVVYLYACAAHKMMGMVGVIQIGKPVNPAEANKAANGESLRFVLNKDRCDKDLAQIKYQRSWGFGRSGPRWRLSRSNRACRPSGDCPRTFAKQSVLRNANACSQLRGLSQQQQSAKDGRAAPVGLT